MVKTPYKLILGSTSPRRKELMQATFLKYEVSVADITEVSECTVPSDIALDIALQKARAVLDKSKEENPLILAADTIVVLGDKILGKPKDEDEARIMLSSLSGKTHQVITGVALLSREKNMTFFESTQVSFNEIDDDLMDYYIKTGESLDKAGAYGIQGYGLSFVANVEGSYSNVVGLPVDKVIIKIKEFVQMADDLKGIWRSYFD